MEAWRRLVLPDVSSINETAAAQGLTPEQATQLHPVTILWPAEPLHGDLYRLTATPVMTRGLARYDIVQGDRTGVGHPTFVRVVERSGHVAVLVRYQAEAEWVTRGSLLVIGAAIREAGPRLLAVDIPPESMSTALWWLAWAQDEGHLRYDVTSTVVRVESS
jgi:hypothetical protein